MTVRRYFGSQKRAIERRQCLDAVCDGTVSEISDLDSDDDA